MRNILLTLFISMFSVNAFAYNIFESSSNHVAGVCSNGSSFAGNKDSGNYWTVSGPGGNHFSRSQSQAIEKACSKKTAQNTNSSSAISTTNNNKSTKRDISTLTSETDKVNFIINNWDNPQSEVSFDKTTCILTEKFPNDEVPNLAPLYIHLPLSDLIIYSQGRRNETSYGSVHFVCKNNRKCIKSTQGKYESEESKTQRSNWASDRDVITVEKVLLVLQDLCD